jgi:hypothetical protein
LRSVLLAAMLLATPALADCLPPDSAISGSLGLLERRHPNGDSIKGWVLMTSDVCIRMENIDGEMTDFNPSVVHIVFDEGKEPANLIDKTGDELAFRGDLMEAHTAWHLGDLVMMDAQLVER